MEINFENSPNDVKRYSMEKAIPLGEYFEELATTKEYGGYFRSVNETVSTVKLGGFCGLRSVSQTPPWAEWEKSAFF